MYVNPLSIISIICIIITFFELGLYGNEVENINPLKSVKAKITQKTPKKNWENVIFKKIVKKYRNISEPKDEDVIVDEDVVQYIDENIEANDVDSARTGSKKAKKVFPKPKKRNHRSYKRKKRSPPKKSKHVSDKLISPKRAALSFS